MKKRQLTRITIVIVLLFILIGYKALSSLAFQKFPIVDATYRIDRARFNNGKFVICTTEQAMDKYILAELTKDYATMEKMLIRDSDFNIRFEKVKNCGECCVAISSYSQAVITKRGTQSHQAIFYAWWPSMPMWANYMAFGGRVKVAKETPKVKKNGSSPD